MATYFSVCLTLGQDKLKQTTSRLVSTKCPGGFFSSINEINMGEHCILHLLKGFLAKRAGSRSVT